jgi:hypothetical protein
MPLDAYSFCPGGTGKRMKFCCKELLGDLQQIDRMIEGEQHQACLQHIERLEPAHPDRACLMAIKAQLLRATERAEELRKVVERFAETHPDNAVALSEMAMLLADDGRGCDAMQKLQQAIAASGQSIHFRLYDAMQSVAEALLSEGQLLAARSLLLYQVTLDQNDRGPLEAIMQLNAAPNIPLLLKQDPPLETTVADVPWKDEFEQAMQHLTGGRWQEAARRLESLSAKTGDAPAIWRNLGAIRAWLADTAGSAAALAKYAALDVPLEDAVEAEALARLLGEDPLGDENDVLSVAYPVQDYERVEAALNAAPLTIAIPPHLFMMAREEGPRPKAGYFLIDRPQPGDWNNVATDKVPRMLAQLLLYGKETDRPARAQLVAISAPRFDGANKLIWDAIGNELEGSLEQNVAGRISASRELLREDAYLPANAVPHDEADRLAGQLLHHALLQDWTGRPLGLLDGKTPREAAAEPQYRVRVLAAIFILQSWSELTHGDDFDFNLLRSELGLPTLEPIDPTQTPIENVSLVRLGRVELAKLTDEGLRRAFHHALAFRMPAELPRFARAVFERPALAASEEFLTACRVLAQNEPDPAQAIGYVDRARKASQKAGQSCAGWDFQELDIRFRTGQVNEATRLMAHIQQQHLREPGVAESLYQIMVQIGAIGPDGRPMMPQAAQEPSIVVPGSGGAEPGKLWTPDSEEPAAQRGKLWTPE